MYLPVSAHLRPAWQHKPDVIHRYAKDTILKKLFPPVLLRICVPVSSLKKSQPKGTEKKGYFFDELIEKNADSIVSSICVIVKEATKIPFAIFTDLFRHCF